jgi:hypothetical protein
MKKQASKEKDIHSQVCRYLKLQYPNVMYNTDLSGIKLTIGQAVKLKNLRSFRGFPDIIIYEPIGNCHGLFVELKRDGERLRKMNGNFVSEHIQEQHECMQQLEKRGYACAFAIGFEQAKEIIDKYLSLKT